MKLLVFCLFAASLCAAADVRVGQPAPPITFNQILQAPSGTNASWDALKGTAVVLEFWATWCPGCVEQIPHLNRLQEQFRGKPVRFISITDDEPGILERFLKERPISGWIGVDTAGRTFGEYGINGRPQTILVDAAGIVRGIGPPSDLTGETMENFLAGKPIVFSGYEGARANLQSMPDPLFEAMVRPAAPVAVSHYSSGAVSGKPGRRFEVCGVPLETLLYYAYDIPTNRIEAPAWAFQREPAYDAAVAAPGLTTEKRMALLQHALALTFELKLHKDPRETEGYVLRRAANVKLRAATETTFRRSGKDGGRRRVLRADRYGHGLCGACVAQADLRRNRAQGELRFRAEVGLREPGVDH
jgi:thiol-disulfide isomerase/thioredoxin